RLAGRGEFLRLALDSAPRVRADLALGEVARVAGVAAGLGTLGRARRRLDLDDLVLAAASSCRDEEKERGDHEKLGKSTHAAPQMALATPEVKLARGACTFAARSTDERMLHI